MARTTEAFHADFVIEIESGPMTPMASGDEFHAKPIRVTKQGNTVKGWPIHERWGKTEDEAIGKVRESLVAWIEAQEGN